MMLDITQEWQKQNKGHTSNSIRKSEPLPIVGIL